MSMIHLYVNNHEPRLNSLGSYEQVKDFVEDQTDVDFEDIKDIEDVTALFEYDNEKELCKDKEFLGDLEFTNLLSGKPTKQKL